MRKKYQSIRLNTESEVNILPLIDVLFAILLFFMLSSIVLTEKNQITVERPSNSEPEKVGKPRRSSKADKLVHEIEETITSDIRKYLIIRFVESG